MLILSCSQYVKDTKMKASHNESKEHIYHVSFKEPRHGRKEFYFTSLAAIYGQFSREDIGCRVERLWAVGVSDGNRYEGRKCTITREAVYRKNRNKAV